MILLEFVPTYEYECPRCPRVFEVRQRISEPPLTTCDRCGGPVHRLLSATPFILKGGGWYVTDYPSESRKKAQSTESSGSGSDSSSKEAAAKDAKPAESKSRDSSSKDSKPPKSKSSGPKSPESKSSDSKSSTSATPPPSSGSDSGAPK
jgi:putative FmdB family regulatory protein